MHKNICVRTTIYAIYFRINKTFKIQLMCAFARDFYINRYFLLLKNRTLVRI